MLKDSISNPILDCQYKSLNKEINRNDDQNYLYPISISFTILRSPLKLSQGYLKAAGLFFSKKKWPIQENP